jgi:MFS family permease
MTSTPAEPEAPSAERDGIEPSSYQKNVSGTASLAGAWYVAIMMCVTYALNIADRYSISTVLEPIRLELHLSDASIAFLTGVSLAIFYVVLGFPVSWLIDRSSRRNIIAVSIALWSALTVATGLARSYWQLLCARIGVGIGEAGGTPGANSILSDYFPPARRPMALQVFALGAPLGAWLGSQIAGAIARWYGWRDMFILLGIPGVAVGALIFLTIREPRCGRLDAQDHGDAPPVLETLRFLWQQRSAVHVMIAGAIVALWGWGLMWWTPAFLMRSYSINVEQAGAILGPIHLLGGSFAMVASTWLLSRPWLSDPRRVVRLLGAYIALATVATAFIYSTHDLGVAKVLFWVFIPALYIYIGSSFGILNNLAQPKMRAIYCATTLFIANVCNLMIAPQAIGFLSDWFAPHHTPTAESLRLALLCLVPTGFWASFHFFWSARDLLHDEQRATGMPASSLR